MPRRRRSAQLPLRRGRGGGRVRDDLVAALHAENVLARRYFYPGCHRLEPYRRGRAEPPGDRARRGARHHAADRDLGVGGGRGADLLGAAAGGRALGTALPATEPEPARQVTAPPQQTPAAVAARRRVPRSALFAGERLRARAGPVPAPRSSLDAAGTARDARLAALSYYWSSGGIAVTTLTRGRGSRVGCRQMHEREAETTQTPGDGTPGPGPARGRARSTGARGQVGQRRVRPRAGRDAGRGRASRRALADRGPGPQADAGAARRRHPRGWHRALHGRLRAARGADGEPDEREAGSRSPPPTSSSCAPTWPTRRRRTARASAPRSMPCSCGATPRRRGSATTYTTTGTYTRHDHRRRAPDARLRRWRRGGSPR